MYHEMYEISLRGKIYCYSRLDKHFAKVVVSGILPIRDAYTARVFVWYHMFHEY
jgi:hypothetical protein